MRRPAALALIAAALLAACAGTRTRETRRERRTASAPAPTARGKPAGGSASCQMPVAASPGHRVRMAATVHIEAPTRHDALALLAEELDVSLIHLAIAFAIEHPAVTSAIIGPRTMEQLESQLGADELELSDTVLDRIDEIVPPGRNVSPAGAGYDPPSLTEPALRRRRRQPA